jgi:hypothetical protein
LRWDRIVRSISTVGIIGPGVGTSVRSGIRGSLLVTEFCLEELASQPEVIITPTVEAEMIPVAALFFGVQKAAVRTENDRSRAIIGSVVGGCVIRK